MAVSSARDVPPQTLGNTAPVAVGKGTKVPILMTVAPTSPYAAQNGTVTYVITVENASNDAGFDVLPPAQPSQWKGKRPEIRYVTCKLPLGERRLNNFASITTSCVASLRTRIRPRSRSK